MRDTIRTIKSNLFANLVVAMSLIIVLANIGSNKITIFMGLPIDCGFAFFPLTYLVVDIANERYGLAEARALVWYGFITSFAVASGIFFIKVMPEYSDWHNQDALNKFFKLSLRVASASLTSYLIGLYLNTYIFTYFKERCQKLGIVARFFFSTAISAFIENFLFYFLAFYGLIGMKQLLSMIVLQYIVKIIYNLFCSYIAIKLFIPKRQMG